MSTKRRPLERGPILPSTSGSTKSAKKRSTNRMMNASTVAPVANDVRNTDLRTKRRGRSREDAERIPESSDNSVPTISRQRPATFHVMTSTLQKQMKDNCRAWAQRIVHDKGIDGLKAEFLALKKPVDPNNSATVFLQQPAGTRNRYRDVVCLDKTRVVLKNAENDYIHANYVATPQSEKKFICTQGPTDTTIGDFWRMVLQERSPVILMLCNFYEKQLKKCAEYFPRVGETVNFENVTVTCRIQKILELPKECTSKIVIRVSGLVVVIDNNTKNPHFVDHYAWLDWPDRGVPPTDLTAINVLNTIRPCKYPIIVHCSAGIGRTGSIVMIEYILELFLAGKPFVQSDQILSKIRDQRSMSIQTDEQYLYVHRVLLEYFYRLNLLDPEQLPFIKKFVEDYNKATQI